MNQKEESNDEKVNKIIEEISVEDELAKLKSQLGIDNANEQSNTPS